MGLAATGTKRVSAATERSWALNCQSHSVASSRPQFLCLSAHLSTELGKSLKVPRLLVNKRVIPPSTSGNCTGEPLRCQDWHIGAEEFCSWSLRYWPPSSSHWNCIVIGNTGRCFSGEETEAQKDWVICSQSQKTLMAGPEIKPELLMPSSVPNHNPNHPPLIYIQNGQDYSIGRPDCKCEKSGQMRVKVTYIRQSSQYRDCPYQMWTSAHPTMTLWKYFLLLRTTYSSSGWLK